MKRVLLPIAIVAVAIAIFMVMILTKPEAPVRNQPEKVWLVNTEEVSRQQYSPDLTLYGRVETPKLSKLSAALSADVVNVYSFEGNKVNKGDVLIELDTRDAQLILIQRQADLDELTALIDTENQTFKRDQSLIQYERELLTLTDKAVTRAEKLEKSRLASQANLDEALANKQKQLATLKKLENDIAQHPARLAQLIARQQRAEALVEQAKLDVERTQIKTPFDGRIASLHVSVGDRVRAGDALVSVYDINALELRAQIPNRLADQISHAMQQEHTIDATAMVAGEKLQFELQRLSGQVQADSGGIEGLFKLTTASSPIALGTFVELSVQLPTQDDVIALPFDALYGLDNVYVIEEGYLKAVQVTQVGEIVTEKGDKKLLLKSEQLKQGDTVVSTQLPNAITGLKVQAIND